LTRAELHGLYVVDHARHNGRLNSERYAHKTALGIMRVRMSRD